MVLLAGWLTASGPVTAGVLSTFAATGLGFRPLFFGVVVVFVGTVDGIPSPTNSEGVSFFVTFFRLALVFGFSDRADGSTACGLAFLAEDAGIGSGSTTVTSI